MNLKYKATLVTMVKKGLQTYYRFNGVLSTTSINRLKSVLQRKK